MRVQSVIYGHPLTLSHGRSNGGSARQASHSIREDERCFIGPMESFA
ncbi:hypothetical protein OKW41_005572 [Paraburkholderia sp. UCT70]